MDLQEILNNAVQAKRADEMKNSPQFVLIELIEQLGKITDKALPVCLDFNDENKEKMYPTRLDSWRGSYCELALNYATKDKAPTVKELLDILKSGIGATFTGYKGGDFTMGKLTPVWVANYGDADNVIIVRIEEKDGLVTLKTKEHEYL